MPQTSKEERAQWAELCERNKPVDWTSNSLGFTLITALPRLLADYEKLWHLLNRALPFVLDYCPVEDEERITRDYFVTQIRVALGDKR